MLYHCICNYYIPIFSLVLFRFLQLKEIFVLVTIEPGTGIMEIQDPIFKQWLLEQGES